MTESWQRQPSQQCNVGYGSGTYNYGSMGTRYKQIFLIIYLFIK